MIREKLHEPRGHKEASHRARDSRPNDELHKSKAHWNGHLAVRFVYGLYIFAISQLVRADIIVAEARNLRRVCVCVHVRKYV